ncbi:MAG: DUF6046 domain-containing protein [Bacteroidales bacterium]|jgi:hypothetical protein|nr:DUF6046 domain-containing protein [Bacteroidales bacterium]
MRIDFSVRFQAAFGYVAGKISQSLKEKGYEDVVKDEMVGLSSYVMNNSSTVDELTLTYGGRTYLFAYRSLSEEYAGVFATPPMIELSRKKNLVITHIDNTNDVEIVERYNTESWDIGLKGLLIDMENHEFPMQKLKELNEIFEVNDPWDVSSEILRAVGVYALYIKEIKIGFVEGFEDTVSYTINARGIFPYVYQLKEN